jgi:septal ring-binding cell division protein DamX
METASERSREPGSVETFRPGLQSVPATRSVDPPSPIRRVGIALVVVAILSAAAWLLFVPHDSGEKDVVTPAEVNQAEVGTPPNPAATSGGSNAAEPNPGTSGPGAGSSVPPAGGEPSSPEASSSPPPTTPTGGGTTEPTEGGSISSPAAPPAVPPATGETAARPGLYRLQVASLVDSSDAVALGIDLDRQTRFGYHVTRSLVGEQVWYAVYLGPFRSPAEAESARVAVKSLPSVHLGDVYVRPFRTTP